MGRPRTVDGILGFLSAYEQLLEKWPADEKRPVTLIAEQLDFNLPQTVEYLSEVLEKAQDIHEPLSRKEADKGLTLLKQRKRGELEAHSRRELKAREKTATSYESMMNKVRGLQAGQNWYSAYRTLSYFAGSNEKYLSPSLLLNICNECLRLGIKSDVNFQELARWLRKGIDTNLALGTPDAFEDALDFIDAYGEHFLLASQERGQTFLSSVLSGLNRPAINLGMLDRLDALAVDLRLPLASLQL